MSEPKIYYISNDICELTFYCNTKDVIEPTQFYCDSREVIEPTCVYAVCFVKYFLMCLVLNM